MSADASIGHFKILAQTLLPSVQATTLEEQVVYIIGHAVTTVMMQIQAAVDALGKVVAQ